jgi:hypothetical protein
MVEYMIDGNGSITTNRRRKKLAHQQQEKIKGKNLCTAIYKIQIFSKNFSL